MLPSPHGLFAHSSTSDGGNTGGLTQVIAHWLSGLTPALDHGITVESVGTATGIASESVLTNGTTTAAVRLQALVNI